MCAFFFLCGGGGGEDEDDRDAIAEGLPRHTALILVSHNLSFLFDETPFVAGGLEHHVL